MDTFRTSGARTPREAPKVGDYRRGSRVRTTRAGTWFPAISPADEPAGLLLLHPAVKPAVLKAVIRRLAELRLPGVLPMLPGLIDQAGRNWLVATAAPTPTVADLLDDVSYGTPDNAIALSAAVAVTLLEVHAQGLAHGAVGAHAVVLGPDGGPMLADWGLDEHPSAEGDVAAWGELAELLAARWCADSPADAALLARAVNVSRLSGPEDGLRGALAVLMRRDHGTTDDVAAEPTEPEPVTVSEPPPPATPPVEPPRPTPAPRPPVATPRPKPRSAPRHAAPEPAASSRVPPADLAPPEAQRYVEPAVEPAVASSPPAEPAVAPPAEPAPPAASPVEPPPAVEPRTETAPPAEPPPDAVAEAVVEADPVPARETRVPAPSPAPAPRPTPRPQPRAAAPVPPPPPPSDTPDRPGRPKTGLARPALLTALLTIVLVTAVAVIIRPFDTKEAPPAEPTGPLQVRAVSVVAQMQQSICLLVGTVTTNGQPGRLVYRWVGENGSQAVASVSTAGYNYQVEIGLIWSPSSPPLHGSSVTLQILEPQPSTTSTVVPIGCI